MDYLLNDEQTMLADALDRFVAERAGSDRKSSPESVAELWTGFAKLGWLGVPYAQDHGGYGLGAVGNMIVAERVGSGALHAPYVSSVVGAGGILARCANAFSNLENLMNGARRIALGLFDDGRGYQPYGTATICTPIGDGYRLTGTKLNVMEIAGADAVIVSAQIDGGSEIALIELALDTPGVIVTPYYLADGRQAARIDMNGTFVGSAARLDKGDASAIIDAVISDILAAAAADNVGAMQMLFDSTLDYVKSRRQFGRPIGSFQDIQFRLVDMWIKLDEARSLVMTASMALTDRKDDARALAAAAWIQSLWSGRLICEEAIQLHGAIGMTAECEVGRYVKRILVNGLLYGAPEYYLRHSQTTFVS